MINRLQLEKHSLEEEMNQFNETKQAMNKYDLQMNEILTMLNDEKTVRGHLRSLASKLIEEVDNLKMQTTGMNSQVANLPGWKNRCSEKRDRFNVQSLQVTLKKEIQVKQQYAEENAMLKQELDQKQNKIQELQNQIQDLRSEIANYKNEIRDLKEEVLIQNKIGTISDQKSNTTNMTSSYYSNETINEPKISSEEKIDTQVNGQRSASTNSSCTQISHNEQAQISEHKFEVISFQTIERCEYCCAIMYGLTRQGIRCNKKGCGFKCHPKCRQNLPSNCPLSINQRVKLKGVDFTRGIGTLMQGHLKIPKAGGVKKGWIEHHVFLSDARLFVCPLVDQKPSLNPVLIIDIRDPLFSVNTVSESDVIHANKRDLPCIFITSVSKLKSPSCRQKFLFCAKDEKDRSYWISVLKELNERLVHAAKLSSDPDISNFNKIEAREICDASSIRNVNSACVFDSERLLIASDEGIEKIDLKTDLTITRFHDKKTFSIDVCRSANLIVAISGKNHQIFLFPTKIIENMSVEVVKIEETKGCSMFCLGKLANTGEQTYSTWSNATSSSVSSSGSYSSPLNTLLCVAVKKSVLIYEISCLSSKPKIKKLREIELTMNVQSIQIINSQLCIGFQSDFALYSIAQESAPIALNQPDKDSSLKFLTENPINALMAVQITSEEFLLVFESKFMIN